MASAERFYVYLYSDENNLPIYVGKGTGKRAGSHLARTDHHPLTQKIQKMAKNGATPTITFIIKDVDDELAMLVEQEAIAKYGRKDLGKGPLCNLTDGGNGVPLTEESLKLLQLAAQARSANPEWKRKNKLANVLKALSPDWKEKQKAGVQKAVAAPGYREKHKAALLLTVATTAWKTAHKEAMEKRWANPLWKEKFNTTMKAVHTSSKWQLGQKQRNERRKKPILTPYGKFESHKAAAFVIKGLSDRLKSRPEEYFYITREEYDALPDNELTSIDTSIKRNGSRPLKPISTPIGLFKSYTIAAQHVSVNLSHALKTKSDSYFYITQEGFERLKLITDPAEFQSQLLVEKQVYIDKKNSKK